MLSAAKAGKDAAEFAVSATAETGIQATREGAALIALDADVVIFAPFDPMTDPPYGREHIRVMGADMFALLCSGKNVLTTLLTLTHWRQLKNGATFRD
jgi:hypothetical protein